jgi:hypothetical protein
VEVEVEMHAEMSCGGVEGMEKKEGGLLQTGCC